MSSDHSLMGKSELQQVAWNTMNVRISGNVPKEQMHDFLQYKESVDESSVNTLRNELIEFIGENKSRLSLPCDGDCYQHHDGVVLYCHRALLEDNKNNGNKET